MACTTSAVVPPHGLCLREELEPAVVLLSIGEADPRCYTVSKLAPQVVFSREREISDPDEKQFGKVTIQRLGYK